MLTRLRGFLFGVKTGDPEIDSLGKAQRYVLRTVAKGPGDGWELKARMPKIGYSATMYESLKQLFDMDLIGRENLYINGRIRIRYFATEKGKELAQRMEELL